VRLADRYDERHLSAAEQAVLAEGAAGVLQWNPLPSIQNLDLSCYDRETIEEATAFVTGNDLLRSGGSHDGSQRSHPDQVFLRSPSRGITQVGKTCRTVRSDRDGL
jgi:hypothetical protein